MTTMADDAIRILLANLHASNSPIGYTAADAIEQLLRERDEYKREWESACERLAADPHGAKLLSDRVAELLGRCARLEEAVRACIGEGIENGLYELGLAAYGAPSWSREEKERIADADAILAKARAALAEETEP